MPLVNVSVTLGREEDADWEPDIETETTDPCFLLLEVSQKFYLYLKP